MSALTSPAVVPIHSAKTGTSRWRTGATTTAGGGGGGDGAFLAQPAATATAGNTSTSKGAHRQERIRMVAQTLGRHAAFQGPAGPTGSARPSGLVRPAGPTGV